MALLEVKNLQKSFGKTKVLKDISFNLEKGQVLVIIGSSGSGKTTLLRCLNFLETPDKGQILVTARCCAMAARSSVTGRFGKTGFISAWCSRILICSLSTMC